MKESELRALATCSVCGKKIGSCGLPMFWKVTIERFGLDAGAIQRQQGLGMMIGGQLAAVMGQNEDLATPLMDPIAASVCELCAVKPMVLAAVAERNAP